MYKPELLSHSLGAHVCAFSTMRGGGYSSGAYATFNANAYCGDDERHVALNRALLCDELGLSADRLIIPHQVHGDRVLRIDDRFFAGDEAARGAALEGVDAVMADLPRVCVSVSTADCIPVLVYDSRHHAVAAVHAGWRGTVLRIVETTLGAMHEAYGTEPSDVQAVIGPGISLDAFEVGDEVYEAFACAGFPMDRIARRFPVRSASGPVVPEKWHIDLWAANRLSLERAGVCAGSIRLSGICTYTRSDRFFSARRLGIRSGRILNGIFLTE